MLPRAAIVRSDVRPKCQFFQDPHKVTSQKIISLNVRYMKCVQISGICPAIILKLSWIALDGNPRLKMEEMRCLPHIILCYETAVYGDRRDWVQNISVIPTQVFRAFP
jgi:hypothetical protein